MIVFMYSALYIKKAILKVGYFQTEILICYLLRI